MLHEKGFVFGDSPSKIEVIGALGIQEGMGRIRCVTHTAKGQGALPPSELKQISMCFFSLSMPSAVEFCFQKLNSCFWDEVPNSHFLLHYVSLVALFKHISYPPWWRLASWIDRSNRTQAVVLQPQSGGRTSRLCPQYVLAQVRPQ